MKSIMEEASSVAKAIENGWIKAGKPKEFTITIFEQPEKNFFGITTKNAKIAILFEEKVQKESASISKKPRPKKQSNKPIEVKKTRDEPRITPTAQSAEAPVWDNEIIDFATMWLKEMLSSIDKKAINFSTNVDKSQLIVTFNAPIVEQEERNRRFLRHLAQLLVQTMRNNLKKPFRGYKIIMKTT